MAASPLKVCIVGSGNWGSAVAKIIGNNVKNLHKFASTVKMWVFEETVNGRKLTDIINNDHENVKYLPGHKLPENVVAVSNLSEAVQDADLLVFVIPHQFIHRICDEITGRVPKEALGITLIKGIDEGPEGLKLISDIIREKMGIDISVLMGANIASEVAAEKFCETTIGSKVMKNGLLFKELLQTPNFRITVVDDADTVELCGALKNIVAVGAGFCDGLRSGDNTKAAVIRLGLMEMIAFARIFCKGQVSTATFLESCGVADLITTCYGGRNRRVAEAFAKTGKTIEELEKEMLNGQKLQGPQTSAEVYRILKQKGLIDKFPLFTAVYQICYEGRPVQEMLSCLQSHPEHI
ncbi:glycerol-3-phosphate dehydrogenase 1 like [Rhinolophus ferrumequinum]|uniref:Glycerol-3-phosphate dehydrogenase [NAD(+)] n=1 Tax=Rhinolophus ferrumequinum TaxID=59479 RepID=A0A671EAJ7_RHIFE|nr:glycerol-3-phosphate dehydrogenase 1-like protein [Rhinolophus ferrumequinum]KAF6312875.1 glycerol-3-phosphate dehydrogenase 1 like [Rhinolophus ferrumequinum]